MNKVEALKNLAVAIGCATSADKITATNIVGVLNYMPTHYGGGQEIGNLTVTSTKGTAAGNTKIAVTPTLTSGNSYVYKTSPSSITAPDYGDDMSSLTTWDGASEIQGEDGHKIGIYEVDSNKLAVKFGQTTMNVKVD